MADTDTVKAFIIIPALVEIGQVALTDKMIAELAKTQEKAGEDDDPIVELELDGNVLIWQPSNLKKAADNPTDGLAPARWGWFSGGITIEEAVAVLSGESGRKPDIELAGMALLVGPRDPETGKFTDVTLSNDELGARIGWDVNRVRARMLLELVRSIKDGEDDNCDCPACQMEKQATTEQRSAAVN